MTLIGLYLTLWRLGGRVDRLFWKNIVIWYTPLWGIIKKPQLRKFWIHRGFKSTSKITVFCKKDILYLFKNIFKKIFLWARNNIFFALLISGSFFWMKFSLLTEINFHWQHHCCQWKFISVNNENFIQKNAPEINSAKNMLFLAHKKIFLRIFLERESISIFHWKII